MAQCQRCRVSGATGEKDYTPTPHGWNKNWQSNCKTTEYFCMKRENQWLFNPELRAEIQFSIDQQAKDLAKLDGMLDSFLDRDEDWNVAELDIAALREANDQFDPELSNILADVVADEVEFAYALWSSNFKDAVKYGKAVTDKLTDSRLSVYRALWFYFTAFSAYAAS